MQDHFDLLGLPRSTALDPETVKARFHELSRDAHPDAGQTDADAFTRLNQAQNCLARPSTRLRHLLELETGEKPPERGAMSPALMRLFTAIADALAKADSHLQRRSKTTTALARALLARDEPAIVGALMAAGGDLARYRSELESHLPELDTDRSETRHLRIADLAREFAFVEKWQHQLQERMGSMAG